MPEKNYPQPTSHEINWKSVVIGIVIGIFLLGAGVLVFNYYVVGSEEVTQKQVTTPKTTETTTSSTNTDPNPVDGTEEWRTYWHKIPKFTIKKAPGFKLDTPIFNPSGASTFTFESEDYKEKEGHQICPVEGATLGIVAVSFSSKGNDNLLEQYVNHERKFRASLYNGTESTSKIDNQNAVKFTYSGPNEYVGTCGLKKGEVLDVYLVFNEEEVPYEIKLRYYEADKQNIELMSKMLQTFKFLN